MDYQKEIELGTHVYCLRCLGENLYLEGLDQAKQILKSARESLSSSAKDVEAHMTLIHAEKHVQDNFVELILSWD